MTKLQSGQNRPWTDPRATVYVEGAQVSALLLGADGRAVDATPWVDATRPARGGVEHLGGAVEGVTVLLDQVEADVHKVVVVAGGFTGTPTAQLMSSDGAVVATVTPAQLSVEKALVMTEVYRRDGGWKVRALGLGYAGGPAELAAAYGAPAPAGPAAPPPPPPPAAPPAPAASAPAPMVVDDPVRQIGMILDDASRTTASFESSSAFAEQRLERDLEQLVGDPSMRMGPRADAARAEASGRRDRLVSEARARHSTDLAQLTAELAELARTLPPSLAPWNAPGWQGDSDASQAAWAFRLGELALESAPEFRMPMVRVLPLAPPLWIETDDGGDVIASRMMSALTTRLMVALPTAPRLSVVDIGGRAALGHLPSSTPVATDANDASRLLQEHVSHLSLVTMALQSGGTAALDDLAPEHRPGRLLLLPDFPGGLDDSSVNAVHQLVTHGPAVGVNVVLSGRRPESLGIAILDLLYDSCLRIPTAPGGDLVDAFGGVSWVFHPDLGPDDPAVAERVQATVRRKVAERDRS